MANEDTVVFNSAQLGKINWITKSQKPFYGIGWKVANAKGFCLFNGTCFDPALFPIIQSLGEGDIVKILTSPYNSKDKKTNEWKTGFNILNIKMIMKANITNPIQPQQEDRFNF